MLRQGHFRTVSPMTDTSVHSPHHCTPVPTVSDPSRRRGAHPLVASTKANTGPVAHIIVEWDRLCRRPAVLRTVNGWEFIGEPIDHLDELLERCGFGRPATDDDGDRMLWHLVARAATDELAARIVLHRMLPALMAIARRRGRIHPDGPYAAMDEVLTCAWIVIRTYPCERRPRKVAANIARDAEYMAFVRNGRLRASSETPVAHGAFEQPETSSMPEPIDELNAVLSDAAQAGVDSHHIELLQMLSTHSTDEIAALQGVSSRTIRNYRRRALDEIRALVDSEVITPMEN